MRGVPASLVAALKPVLQQADNFLGEYRPALQAYNHDQTVASPISIDEALQIVTQALDHINSDLACRYQLAVEAGDLIYPRRDPTLDSPFAFRTKLPGSSITLPYGGRAMDVLIAMNLAGYEVAPFEDGDPKKRNSSPVEDRFSNNIRGDFLVQFLLQDIDQVAPHLQDALQKAGKTMLFNRTANFLQAVSGKNLKQTEGRYGSFKVIGLPSIFIACALCDRFANGSLVNREEIQNMLFYNGRTAPSKAALRFLTANTRAGLDELVTSMADRLFGEHNRRERRNLHLLKRPSPKAGEPEHQNSG